jgi:hypothetical protein
MPRAHTAEAMDKLHCLKIARRISTLLTEQLGEGVDAQRMVDVPLYARDVLLVCEAMDHAELGKLARMFRQSLLDAAAAAPRPAESSGISSVLNSIFGPAPDSGHPPEHDASSPRPKVWRWLRRNDRAGAAVK